MSRRAHDATLKTTASGGISRKPCVFDRPRASPAAERVGVAAANRNRMATMLLTCPETAHLELVEFESHPLGMLIDACTRFPCEVNCARTCAARLDQRTRLAGDSTKCEAPHARILHLRSLMHT